MLVQNPIANPNPRPAPSYLHVTRYADRPVGLAEVKVYLPPAYVPRECLVDAKRLLEIYRALRQAGPVKLYFH